MREVQWIPWGCTGGRQCQLSLPFTPHPWKASQGEPGIPRRKRTVMKWDLRWLLGSFRILLSVKGNKGKDDDTSDSTRMVEKVMGGTVWMK